MKSILFVRGFATSLKSDCDDYLHLKHVLSERYEVIYFDYDTLDDIRDVYKRLSETIESRHFDILMGHSLGGGLLTQYIKYNPEKVQKYDKIILLMPFICKNIAFDIVSQFSFILNNCLLPKGILAPSWYLHDDGNILNNYTEFISYKQPCTLYTCSDTPISNDVSFIEDNPNITVFYASDERLNVIDESILQTIPRKQLKRVNGLHECWRSIRINNPYVDFFTQLKSVLNR
jgi:hypothetical protein